MRTRHTRRAFIKSAALTSAAAYALPVSASHASADWRYYGGSQEATRYSALDQIDASNVAGLKVAWTHASGDSRTRPATTIECTPIVVDGTMYVTTAQLQVRALEATSRKMLWNFDPFEGDTSRLVLL